MALESATNPPGGPAALEVTSLRKDFRTGVFRRKIPALRDVSFSIPQGRIVALLGPNGSGKTTLIKILTGLVRPTGGSFRILGEKLSVRVRSRIGFMPDRFHQYPFLTPQETLSFDADIFGLRGKAKVERIERVLDAVGIRAQKNVRMRYFSKGMLQRVTLAQALINDPDLLILDEPISALDPRGVRLMRAILASLKEAGKTVIFATHLLSYARDICDDLLVLNKGRLVYQGSLPPGRDMEELFLQLVPEE